MRVAWDTEHVILAADFAALLKPEAGVRWRGGAL
jgi:hypothetical protein